MARQRLDQTLFAKGLVQSRSQAENLIKLGQVQVNGRVVTKASQAVDETTVITVATAERYVSRAALKLASIAETFKLNVKGATVLDVGSSTGGFTDYALQHGAKKVIAVEVGKDQLHPSLRNNTKIELHEQTDIRSIEQLSTNPDVVVIDVSFVSLRDILPHVATLITKQTVIIAMVKPQFEAPDTVKHKGVIKNERMRRDILNDFETWVKNLFAILDKSDSKIAGNKGNVERFYKLRLL